MKRKFQIEIRNIAFEWEKNVNRVKNIASGENRTTTRQGSYIKKNQGTKSQGTGQTVQDILIFLGGYN